MSTDKENSTSEELKAEESANEDMKPDSKPDDKAAGDTPTKAKDKDASKKRPKPRKEVKSESEDNDENDENDEKEDSDGKVPLLDQPLELSGTRERKKVTRFSEEFKSEPKEAPAVEIPEGHGTALGLIPIIDANIQRYKTDDLKALHRILFNRTGKAATLKKNIRKFNGFDFDEKSEHYAKKKQALQKCEMKVLNGVCFILDLKKGTKQDNVDRILDFLMKPADSGKPLPKKRSKRSSTKSNKSYSESEEEGGSGDKRRSIRSKGIKKSLKEVDSSDGEMDTEGQEDEKKTKKKAKGGKKKKDSKKESDDEKDNDKDAEENNAENDENDGEEDGRDGKDEDEASSDDDSDDGKKGKKSVKANNKKAAAKKENAKKPTPKKVEKKAAKKRSSKSDDESSEDEPLVKKNKAPPTDEEIRSYVKEILDGANLEETTMKTVCKQVYANYPDFDLSHKKDFIKTTVKSLIST